VSALHPAVKFASPRHITTTEDCYFYHTLDIPGHGTVGGAWDLRGKFDEYIGGVSLSGKTVLDVGTASGFLTFEAEKRGGTVVSFDMEHGKCQTLLPFKDKLYSQDRARWAEQHNISLEQLKNGYWFAHRHFASKAKVFYGDIYRLPRALGAFDVSFVGGVLEHLSDQVSALASVARLTRSTLVLPTPMLDTEERIARFEPAASNPDQDYTWWTYSRGIYREVLAMLGFRIERVTTSSYFNAQMNVWGKRPTLVAVRTN
jgi:SAM-dependent methyltransferase